MPGLYRTQDFESFALVVELPEAAELDIETRVTGSREYLAGTALIDGETITTYLADMVAADRFLLTDDGAYIRITGAAIDGVGGVLYLDQSRETPATPPGGGDPVMVRVVEPSPPTTPLDWFFTELDRALADL
ncbi:hypothetical protein [Nocardia abscessus]|uniref:hypothetical protein n=1 Tax=Nocardia abscessus TaxID=120957 RepID=UPI002454E18C|nr:hypothetical protein [Nocardia abscessus]